MGQSMFSDMLTPSISTNTEGIMANKHNYGRGTYEAHPKYIEYMEMIVNHQAYAGMPGARDESGRVRWQVSSGKTTSFYQYYVARERWWASKADSLGLPGKGKEQERFSISARMIHPTGLRPCRLCGEDWRVGYFYLNALLAKRFGALAPGATFAKMESISIALPKLVELVPLASLQEELHSLFPERRQYFDRHGISSRAFEDAHALRTKWLSPGFMCNPPDRLEGFHDYCVKCRPHKDPGRSVENMRSYVHDRRAFQWWAEGDWKLADALYNAAGPGVCAIQGEAVDKVSPDHIGPLACGFKHIPLFRPTCQRCNSAKNRRMRLADVESLRHYESAARESPASWQVRSLWDSLKGTVSSDAQAVSLSNLMREQQDLFLRVLNELRIGGEAAFLATLLAPEYAFYDIEFLGLDSAKLTFSDYRKTRNDSALRASLACRTVRIAFEELIEYCEKERSRRKHGARLFARHEPEIRAALSAIAGIPLEAADKQWRTAAESLTDDPEGFEASVAELLPRTMPSERHRRCRSLIQAVLDAGAKDLAALGLGAALDEL